MKSVVVALGIVLGTALATPLATSAIAGTMPELRMPVLVPKSDHAALRATIYAAFPRSEGRWGAVHVVDRSCSVSQSVVKHLLERRASSGADELVIVIDDDGETRPDDIDLVHAGYRVRVMSRDQMNDETRRMNVASSVAPARPASSRVSKAEHAATVIAVPALIVARPDGTLAYVGGHRTDLSLDAVPTAVSRDGFVDLAIVNDLVRTGSTTLSAPAIGCSR